MSIAPTRQALTARFTPAADRRTLLALIAHADAVRDSAGCSGRLGSHDRGLTRALFTACRRYPDREPGRVTSDRELARHAVALSSTTVRDTVWLAVDDGRLPDPGLWLELARRLPEPWNAPPLFLYGWHAWRRGNGALSAMAAERALDADPTYSAADLLLGALAAGVNPRTVPTLRPSAEPTRPRT